MAGIGHPALERALHQRPAQQRGLRGNPSDRAVGALTRRRGAVREAEPHLRPTESPTARMRTTELPTARMRTTALKQRKEPDGALSSQRRDQRWILGRQQVRAST